MGHNAIDAWLGRKVTPTANTARSASRTGDPFSAYGASAGKTGRQQPDRLVGPTKTRKEVKVVYAGIVAELAACEDEDMLDAYLASIAHHIAQFKAELPFFWDGDSMDFKGLAQEIEQAWQEIRDSVSDMEWYVENGAPF